jgi:hypothetical protein
VADAVIKAAFPEADLPVENYRADSIPILEFKILSGGTLVGTNGV